MISSYRPPKKSLRQLQNPKTLCTTKLSLCHDFVSDYQASEYEALDLANSALSTQTIHLILETFSSAKIHLLKLNLANNGYFSAIQHYPPLDLSLFGNLENLIELDLSANRLDSTWLPYFKEATEGFPELTVLVLRDNQFKTENLDDLFEAISWLQLPNLTHLDLSGNFIRNKGIEKLSDLLEETPSLTTLCLNYCDLSNPCLEDLIVAINALPALKHLHLEGNLINPELLETQLNDAHLETDLTLYFSPPKKQLLIRKQEPDPLPSPRFFRATPSPSEIKEDEDEPSRKKSAACCIQ